MFPAHYEDRAWRIGMFGDEIESIVEFDPLTGAEDAGPRIRQSLRQFALCDAAPDAAAVDRGDEARAESAAGSASGARAAARGAAARAAHVVRSRNAGGDRLLRRHRELFALSDRPQARRAAADAVRISSRQRARLHRREPCHHPADRRHVSRRLSAQGDARPNTAFRLPSCMDNRPLRFEEWERDAAADRACLGDAGQMGNGADRRRLSSSR